MSHELAKPRMAFGFSAPDAGPRVKNMHYRRLSDKMKHGWPLPLLSWCQNFRRDRRRRWVDFGAHVPVPRVSSSDVLQGGSQHFTVISFRWLIPGRTPVGSVFSMAAKQQRLPHPIVLPSLHYSELLFFEALRSRMGLRENPKLGAHRK